MYAVVTGASSGLGRELAFLLAEEGYNLVLIARREDRLKEIKKALSKYEIDVKLEELDLSVQDNCFELFNRIKKLNVDLLINNAGFGYLGLFSETDLDKELNMIDLNIKAVQILTKLYIKNFDKGNVVNIGSSAGFLPMPRHSTYSASKAYVNRFSRAINYELKRQEKNVRVLVVTPGPVKTEFNEVANASINRGMTANKCAKIIIKGIKKRKALIIPGLSIKLLYFFVRFFPNKMLSNLGFRIQNNK
ncbi:SDR family NAD(P)-dependent oxidoreductase [Mycoplasmatota bacterium WC30]